jgi:8-amino-7-oxononanoate synthase
VNFGRAYIYSTNVPPSVPARIGGGAGRATPRAASAGARALARAARARVALAGVAILPGRFADHPHRSRSEEAAVAEATRLMDAGLLVMPIRPPTVPPGTSRLRVTLSSEHTDEQVDALIRSLVSR